MTGAPARARTPRASGPPPAAERQLRLLGDALLSRAVQVAATLRLADHIGEAAQSAEDLAGLTGCHPGLLRRLLRYLAFAEVFTATEDGRYALTAMSRLLRSDEPGSLRAELAIGADNRALWWSTGEMLYTARTGQPAFDHIYGVSMWEMMHSGSGSATRFQREMTDGSAEIADNLIARYDWPEVGTIADLGGGTGSVLSQVLRAGPGLRGVLMDVPAVAEAAERELASAGLTERCTVVSGDLFADVPAGADVYLLIRVLHDWPDDRAEAILRNCRRACGEDSQVIVVDMEVGTHDVRGTALASDIMMSLLVGGCERSEAEMAGLLAAAGLGVTRRIELCTPYIAVEARPC